MKDYFVTDTTLVLKIESNELMINLKKMRLACPCAHCKGEKDIFGNIYKSDSIEFGKHSFQIYSIRRVGNYALQAFWRDKHKSGIYTFDLLKNLSD